MFFVKSMRFVSTQSFFNFFVEIILRSLHLTLPFHREIGPKVLTPHSDKSALFTLIIFTIAASEYAYVVKVRFRRGYVNLLAEVTSGKRAGRKGAS